MMDQRTAYFTQGKPPRKHLTQMGIAKWRKTKTFNKAFTCRAVFCRHISDGSTLTRWSGSRDPTHNRFSKYFHNRRILPPPLLDTLKYFLHILKICKIEPHSLMCSYDAYKTYSNQCVSYSRLEFPGRLLSECASRSHKEGLNTHTNAS